MKLINFILDLSPFVHLFFNFFEDLSRTHLSLTIQNGVMFWFYWMYLKNITDFL